MPTRQAAAKTPEPQDVPSAPPIVGIAGSAGALTALEAFFEVLPADTGLAFVVVTHLSPEHESHMASLLQSHTQMGVTQVNEKMLVEPNQVYVIPPSRNILISDSHVDVAEFTEPRGRRAPIDFFFRTLARSHRDAVAIILSGGGTDGSVGIKEVKEQGGLIMVQDPKEAEYSSMPNAAIATGLADIVLRARDLASRLTSYARDLPGVELVTEDMAEQEWGVVQNILAQLRRQTKHDFSQYKHSTMLRRIRRRMLLNGDATLPAYLEHIKEHPEESAVLLNDLLIGVTNFFRDHLAWEALASNVLPLVFKAKDLDVPVRIWSVGCASGEEAYSLAMLCQEVADSLADHHTVQIFASDIDEDALGRARQGIYPSAVEADVSSERLERFFTRHDDHYKVKRELRDMVLFTPHSVLRDPPFSHQDLIVCRNLLIYLQRDVQQYVLEVFHYSLNPGGYLFLGNSEWTTGKESFFRTADKAHHIYQSISWRTPEARIPPLPLLIRSAEHGRTTPMAPSNIARLPSDVTYLEEQHQRSLERYGPPSILVNSASGVLHISETAGRYLLQQKGPISDDLVRLVRPELQADLRSGLYQALEHGKSSLSSPLRVMLEGEPRRVMLGVYPREAAESSEDKNQRQALVVFLEDEARPESAGQEPAGRTAERLQVELGRLREQLQTTTEEYEGSSEEMKAVNEELQSINEEYHLTTEELETSKEELEAVNEELQTVNNELKSKLEEISLTHRDLENVMGAMEIATLFLDRQLRIQRFTPALTQFFNILKSDIGRPIEHLANKLGGYGGLTQDAQRVLDSLGVVDREFEVPTGGWFLIRLRPYRTVDDKIEGVVVTFVDVTAGKQAELALRQMNETLETRVRERTTELEESNRELGQIGNLFSTLFNVNPIPTSLTRLHDGMFIDVNDAYCSFFGLSREKILGHTSLELHLPFQGPQRDAIIEKVKRDGHLRNMELEVSRHNGDSRTVVASLQYTAVGGANALLSTFIDITERVKADRQIRALAASVTAAEQRERHRISQVLHDDLQQRLFSVKIQLSFLQEAYRKSDMGMIQKDSANLESWLDDAIETTRRLSIDLSPMILQGENVGDALTWLVDEMRSRYGFELVLNLDGHHMPRLDDDLRVLLFHSIRELLFNVVKHAEVPFATITVEQADGRLRITVHDQGKGFDARSVMTDSKSVHGLLELRNRLTLAGCTMQIESLPGEGTTITIEAPVQIGAAAT
ncbi:MAG: CheR family methyltransferase [Anaerolineae bacterium]